MNTKKFTIRVGGKRNTRDVISAGHFDQVNPLVTEKNFPLRREPVAERVLVLLDLGSESVESGEALAEAQRLRLARPRYQDAWFFAEQCPDEQVKGPIVFLHDAWYFSGHWFYFVLDVHKGHRRLRLLNSGGRWPRGCRFAFLEM